jgi:hypothetical protein
MNEVTSAGPRPRIAASHRIQLVKTNAFWNGHRQVLDRRRANGVIRNAVVRRQLGYATSSANLNTVVSRLEPFAAPTNRSVTSQLQTSK